MKLRHIVACALSAFCLVGVSPAAAFVVLTSDTNSIVVGQSITFELFVFPSSSGFGEAFFNSGDGQPQQIIDIGSGAPGIPGATISVTYLTPGVYTASANGEYDYAVFDSQGNQLLTVGPGSGPFNLTESITVSVPEPPTWAMMLIGFAGLGFAACRRNRKSFGGFAAV
jgi:hypothetical protein